MKINQDFQNLIFLEDGIFPSTCYEMLLDKTLKDVGLNYSKKKGYLKPVENESTFLSLELTKQFYSDFIQKKIDKLLFNIITNDLENLLWKQIPGINERFKESEMPNKYRILYTASDNNRLQFTFGFDLNTQEENAWDKMIVNIINYETNTQGFRDVVIKQHAQENNIRFFEFSKEKIDWIIRNPLAERTLELSKEFFNSRNDNRTRKPNIILTEENYNQRLLIDKEQWVLKIGGISIILPQPNDVSLHISLSDKCLLKAKEFYYQEYHSRCTSYPNPLLDNEKIKGYYDYFEDIIAAIIFSFSSIEAFVNTFIVDGYVYNKKVKDDTKVYTKEMILGKRGLTLREKLNPCLKDILNTPNPAEIENSWWQKLIDLENLRDEFIHTTQSNSEDRYSKLLNERVFELIDVNKEIIKFYGEYIDKNKRELLIDYPYGFGYDNVLNSFISKENYISIQKKRRGIN